MKARTVELLYYFLWSVDELVTPTYRDVNSSFESWAYRKGILRELHELERRDLVESIQGKAATAVYRLSERGRLVALCGRDPVVEWRRSWDGAWRMILFDLPESQSSARNILRRFLKANRFGYLQNSVWITPDPLNKVAKKLSAMAEDVESIVTLEARPASGERNAAIVTGAWNFERINELYQECIAVMAELPLVKPSDDESRAKLQDWANREREAWWKVAAVDPYLPEPLLPSGYLGMKAWEERVRVLKQAGTLIANS